jgi:acyl carrier protein
MHNREIVRAKIAAILGSPVEKVADDEVLKDLVLSSFLFVEMVIELQEEFSVHFVQQDMDALDTVADLLDLVAGRMSEND